MYKQVWGDHVQIGLVAGASCQDYQDDVIKKHELTREDKERDRQRHIETLHAQTGPVFLTYKRVQAIDKLIAKAMTREPESDFSTYDGVRHVFLVVDDDLRWVGTSNWGYDYFFESRNVEVILKRPDVAKVLDALFLSLWSGPYVHRLDPDKDYQAPKIN